VRTLPGKFGLDLLLTLTKNYVVKHNLEFPLIDINIDWQFMEYYIKFLPLFE